MMLSLCVTHKNTSVTLRESLTFKDHEQALMDLCSLDFVEECVLLQTCNRIEIHLVTANLSTSVIVGRLIRFWSQTTKVSKDVLLKVVEVFEGREALRHLLLLASGIESMVVGEDQILGQMRKAYFESKEAGATKSVLDTIFTKALKVGRKVRVQTRVNKGSVSISSVAVGLAEKCLDNSSSVKALIIGAGKTGELAAKELSKREVDTLYVANRTHPKSVALAKLVGGQPIKFEEIYDYLSKVELVIAAISTSKPLLTFGGVKKALNDVSDPNLLFVDLSQPRCIEEEVGALAGVRLKNIDDLSETVEENLQKRIVEAAKATKIVDDELEHLEALLKKMAAEPIISNICKKVEEIRCVELSKALHMINGINEEQRLVIENLTRELVERILNLPIEKMRNATLNGDNSLLVAANILFNLNVED